jgi:hypothetical protein
MLLYCQLIIQILKHFWVSFCFDFNMFSSCFLYISCIFIILILFHGFYCFSSVLSWQPEWVLCFSSIHCVLNLFWKYNLGIHAEGFSHIQEISSSRLLVVYIWDIPYMVDCWLYTFHFLLLYCSHVTLGGLMVACLPLDPRFEFQTWPRMMDFKGDKNL